MQIIDHYIGYTDIYHEGSFHKMQKKTLYQSASEVFVSLAKKTPLDKITEKRVIFFDECFFSFYRFDITLSSLHKFTIKDLRIIIDKKLQEIKNTDSFPILYVKHHVKNIFRENSPVDFIFGQTGKLSFSLYLSLLNQDGIALCLLMGGEKVFSHPYIEIYPRNFFLLRYINVYMKKKNYAFLYIYNTITALILVEDGQYSHVHYLNIGTQTLKLCYQEQDVEKYFYTNRHVVIKNYLLSKLVDEAISFFTDNLCQRLHQYVLSSQDIVVIGDVIRNPSFLPNFQESYKAFGLGYIIPFFFDNKKNKNTDVLLLPPHIFAFYNMKES